MPFNQKAFLQVASQAVRQSVGIVRGFFTQDATVLSVEKKESDNSLVTVADKTSDDACFSILHTAFPSVSILREEGGQSPGTEDWMILVDPLDGTSAFTLGLPTSTVIVAAYSLKHKRLLAVVVGDPAYGRLWQAADDMSCRCFSPDQNGSYDFAQGKQCRVWDGQLGPRSTVFLGSSRAIQKKTSQGMKELLRTEDIKALIPYLTARTKIMLPGSEGINHALVAQGGAYMAGAISTAISGPWDAAGALLVKQAGGVIRAFNIEPDRTLSEQDPLDPLAYDLLVSANNAKTVDVLCEALFQAVRA